MVARITYAFLGGALFFALMFCIAAPAYAYVDPGSGLLVCQSVGTVFAGILFYFRKRLKVLARRSANHPGRR